MCASREALAAAPANASSPCTPKRALLQLNSCARQLAEAKLKEMGPMSRNERIMLSTMGAAVLLWVGWAFFGGGGGGAALDQTGRLPCRVGCRARMRGLD